MISVLFYECHRQYNSKLISFSTLKNQQIYILDNSPRIFSTKYTILNTKRALRIRLLVQQVAKSQIWWLWAGKSLIFFVDNQHAF